jgi:nucleotide-binding universal stress UspA family protein
MARAQLLMSVVSSCTLAWHHAFEREPALPGRARRAAVERRNPFATRGATMSVVCGIDHSDSGARAARTAAAIARRLATPLDLVHVIDELGSEMTQASEPDRYDPLRQQVERLALELKRDFGAEIRPRALAGVAHRALIDVARSTGAELLVVAASGATASPRLLLGSTADRVARASPIPVLVVRNGSSLEAWAEGKATLRVMVGVELASTSRAALSWACHLRDIGPCDLLVTQVVWPDAEEHRRSVPAGEGGDGWVSPELHDLLLRDLRAFVGQPPGAGETVASVSPGWGRFDAQLASLAAEARVDLLVVGTHQRSATARLWQGSVSRGVLEKAPCNVACVPRSERLTAEESMPTLRSVLIPTDLSAPANRAIPVGYGMVVPGGVVHLLHVVTRESAENFDAHGADPLQRLRELVPRGAAAKGIQTECEVVSDNEAGTTIARAAERLGIDAICMATRGRSGLTRMILGSQAEQVLQRVRQPVVLVPPERDG